MLTKARLTATFAAALLACRLAAADNDVSRSINVTGEAEIKVVPDKVLITCGVQTFEPSMEKALAANDERTAAILKFAASVGLSEEQIQADEVDVQPEFKSRNSNVDPYELAGYRVRKSIVLTLTDLSRFQELVTGVLTSGATHIHDVQFLTTELRKHRDAARAAAIRAAKEKAVALAGELGQSVGRPRMINEQGSGWYSWYNRNSWGYGNYYQSQNYQMSMNGPMPEGSASVAIGRISVTASVMVTFELTDSTE